MGFDDKIRFSAWALAGHKNKINIFTKIIIMEKRKIAAGASEY